MEIFTKHLSHSLYITDDVDSLYQIADGLNCLAVANEPDIFDTRIENGRRGMIDHMSELVRHSAEIILIERRNDHQKIQELEEQVTKYKKVRELQQLIKDPDFSDIKDIFNTSKDDGKELTQERKDWLENACIVSEQMRMDGWKDELVKLEAELNDDISPDSIQSDSDILEKSTVVAA